MYRYMAIISHHDSVQAIAAAFSASEAAFKQWKVVFNTPGMLVAECNPRPGYCRAHAIGTQDGVILGALFHRGGTTEPSQRAVHFDETESRRIVSSGCQHLVSEYWGRYVALVLDSGRRRYYVLRDPTAQMPCYHVRLKRIDVFFSHTEDFLRFTGIQLSVDWKYLTARMLAGEHTTRRTGFTEIEDIPGGERLTVSGDRIDRKLLWNPADVCRRKCIDDVESAIRTMRSTVQNTVVALASNFERIALSLSGGLDSSIVAGCLSCVPKELSVTCLNYYLTVGNEDEAISMPGLSPENLSKLRRVAGHADERRFAKLVCNRWGYAFVEHERRVQDIEMARAFEAPLLSSPSGYVGMMDLVDAESRLVRENESDAFFSGLGGDTVFYATFQPLGIIDYAYTNPFGRQTLAELVNAWSISKESLWRTARKAVRYGLLKQPMPPVYDVLARPNLLTDEAVSTISQKDIEHPWLGSVEDLPPGKRYHVLGLSHSALFYKQEQNKRFNASVVNPLTAQPIVEACLQIPTYLLLSNGVSRGLARRAFTDLLPAEISRRTTKGSGSPFFQRLVRVNMELIRERLLDGVLAHERILDRARLEKYLVSEQQFTTVIATQILNYVATEAWLSSSMSVAAHIRESGAQSLRLAG